MFTTFFAVAVATLAASPAPADCSCAALLDMTIRKVEETYIGYHLEVTDETRERYEARKEASRRTARAPDVDCYLVIREWIDGFGDPHLFLLESPGFDEAQLDSLRLTAVQTGVTEALIRRALADHRTDLDSIEGLWYATSGRYGIVRDAGSGSAVPGADVFRAIVLESEDEGWVPGEEKARFTRTAAGYDVLYRMPDHSTRRYRATLHRGNLLVMPAMGWAKIDPRFALPYSRPMPRSVTLNDMLVARVATPSSSSSRVNSGYVTRLHTMKPMSIATPPPASTVCACPPMRGAASNTSTWHGPASARAAASPAIPDPTMATRRVTGD